MPNITPQQHQGGWEFTPDQPPAGRALSTAVARPKVALKVRMLISQKMIFRLFSEFLKITRPHRQTFSTIMTAASLCF